MTDQTRVEAKKLKGFRDFSPAECRVRERIIQAVRATAERAGFEEISTPALEYREVLLGSGGEEADKECYTFTDHGDRAVAMRYDLTVPFARYVAEHQGTMFFPFKKLQIGEVWRGEKPQKGRYRQFCQADIDIIGSDSIAADVEIISCIVSALGAVLPVPFTYSVGNRILLSAIIRQMLGAAGQQQETKVLGGLDKLKKIGPDGVTDIVAALPGMDRAAVTDLVRFVQSQAKGVDQSAVENLLRTDAAAAQELARYVRTIEILQQHSARQAIRGTIVADLSLARGLGYYTGVVFEGTVNQLPGIGSISGGGRYNQLVSRFSNREFAGVGGSVGVDRVLAALEELGLDADQARRGVFVAIATGDALGYGFEILSQVRAAGLRSDIGMQPGKLGNQFKHADRLHYAYVITVGSEEMSRREFSMKDLQTGAEQRGMALADLDSTLRSSTNR